MYYVYALFGKKYDKFYIGFTENLRQRVREHTLGEVHTTHRMDKTTLIYYEACLSKKDATARERQLKTGFGRLFLRKRLKYSILDD